MIIDSHCHLDYSALYEQLDDVLKRAESNQVKYLLTICTTLESFEKKALLSVINCLIFQLSLISANHKPKYNMRNRPGKLVYKDISCQPKRGQSN